MNLFGRKKPTASAAEATSKMRDMLDILQKKEQYLQKKIEAETEIAKANATKNKRVAMMALRRKQQYENEAERLCGTISTLETQLMAIENANVNLEAMEAMKAGAAAMRSIHGKVSIDTVDTTMDDIREQMDLAGEISQAISQPLRVGADVDEELLEEELALLEQQALDERLLHVGKVPSKPIAQAEDEEDELEKLKASMAL